MLVTSYRIERLCVATADRLFWRVAMTRGMQWMLTLVPVAVEATVARDWAGASD